MFTLALILLPTLQNHINDNDKRAEELRAAQTRNQLLRLASAWNVPYISQHEWERELDTNEGWFKVAPVSRVAPCPYLKKKVVVLARMDDVRNAARQDEKLATLDASSIGRGGEAFEGMWDWEESATEESGDGWLEADSGLMVRPRVAPDGVRMLYSRNVARSDSVTMRSEKIANDTDELAVLEFAPSRKLVEVRDIMRTIENVWGFRCHQQQIYAKSRSDDNGWVELAPASKLVDVATVSTCVGTLEQTLPLQLSKREWHESKGGELELNILSFCFDSDALCDKHRIRHPLLWYETVEGARHQVFLFICSDDILAVLSPYLWLFFFQLGCSCC